MSRLSIGVGSLLLLLTMQRAAPAKSAEEMISSCKGVAQAEVKDKRVQLPEDFESGECWGWFSAVQMLGGVTNTQTSQPLFLVCAPADSTRTQYVHIFVEYVRRNPKKLHEEFFWVAVAALREAFSCNQDPAQK